MKKIIKYLLYILFAVCGAISMSTNPQWSPMYVLGFINVLFFGGYLIIKLMNYLEE